ncbi:hypothetical protein A9299_09945 [Moraxella osloensis]|uniref:Uncharacterized protein n=1 Tax=Faucicola osloensis TaxID=34062 RepID=A0AA91FT23_FAUOS|nr:hypothetical protein [Moraxella osloensis]OBX64319.1 hypothetical protein A9299_09945 [Moraxella osloensis]
MNEKSYSELTEEELAMMDEGAMTLFGDNQEEKSKEPSEAPSSVAHAVATPSSPEASVTPIAGYGDNLNNIKPKDVINAVFVESGMKTDENDPLVHLVLANLKLIKLAEQDFRKNIDEAGKGVVRDIQQNQALILKGFDQRKDELNTLLTKLEGQKEVIITDVWSKLNEKVTAQIQNQLTKDLQKIANNANNKVNTQRNMLIGGGIGIIVGILITVIVSLVK